MPRRWILVMDQKRLQTDGGGPSWVGLAVMLVLAVAVVFFAFCGCASPTGTIAVSQADKLDTISQDVSAVKTTVGEIAAVSVKAGGDVNEPVTGWILAVAAGIALISYPAGKLVWIILGSVSRKKKDGDDNNSRP